MPGYERWYTCTRNRQLSTTNSLPSSSTFTEVGPQNSFSMLADSSRELPCAAADRQLGLRAELAV